MLNLNVNIDLKRTEIPIYFDGKNECVVCGGINTLDFIDRYGNRHKDEVKAFDHIKCRKCGRIYSILWQKRENSNKMYPSAVEPNVARDFINILNRDVKNTGEKHFIN